MYKLLIWLLLITPWKLVAAPIPCAQVDSPLIDQQQQPTSLLKQLLLLYGISANTLDEIVTETQRHWIAVQQGAGGIERRDLIDNPAQQALREQTINLAVQLALFEARNPTFNHYPYAICLGAFLEGARARFALLLDMWKNGIRFDSLIFLGSDRPLRSKKGENEELTILCDQAQAPYAFKPGWLRPNPEARYETESDMLKLIWEQADVPQDMLDQLQGKVVFIEARSVRGKRPATGDCFREWLKNENPQPGRVLAASSPLLSNYQHLVGLNALGPDYPLETICRAGNPSEAKVTVILDTIAKCLYELAHSRYSSENFKY